MLCQFASSRPVAIAKRIVARTASISGVHVASSVAAFPPRYKDMLPLPVSVHCSISLRCVVHLLHRKRKWSTVSRACPQSHWSVLATLMR